MKWVRVLRTPIGIVGVTMLAIVVLMAVFAPILWGTKADAIDTDNILAGSSSAHWIGTDNLGRDLFARTLVATRLSIVLAVLATLLGVGVGLVLGAAPMLVGRRVGRLLTAVINILVAFPGLLLVLFFAVVFGVGTKGAVLAVGIAGAPSFARLCQTLMAGVEQRDFVAAARTVGVGRFRILVRHVLPNIAEPLVVNATISAGGVLLSFAGLSFLGLGVQQPSYDWGKLMQDGLQGIYIHPLAAITPGLAVIFAGLAFNLTGEAIARAFGVSAETGLVSPLARVRGGEVDLPEHEHSAAPADSDVVLDVRDLTVAFPGPSEPIQAVRGVSFQIRQGEAVGVVGESGSGKSVTALAVAQLVEAPGVVDASRLTFCGTDLLDDAHGAERRKLLGTSLAVVFQDPSSSFNPTHRIGSQIVEAARAHEKVGRRSVRERALARLREVRISNPERRYGQYPFEFSGSMRQRAMIAMGLMGSPRLIIADEPTTALDVTVQKQVLDVLSDVRAEHGSALLFISHDITVVAEVCDRVLVMYNGRIVEELRADELRTAAKHPYTKALIASVPDMSTDIEKPLATFAGQTFDTEMPETAEVSA